MSTGEVILLGLRSSPFSNRVQIALNLKTVCYKFLEETWGSKSELLLKSNSVHKKIPVFFHQDRIICESLIIVQYIDEVWTNGPSILPSDPFDRAFARFWAGYIDDTWYPLTGELKRAQGEEAKAAVMEKMGEGLVLLEELFVKCSKGKAYFGGDSIGFLDIALGSCLGWLRVVEKLRNTKLLNETKTPRLLAWAARFCSDDAVKDVILEPKKLIELLKLFRTEA